VPPDAHLQGSSKLASLFLHRQPQRQTLTPSANDIAPLCLCRDAEGQGTMNVLRSLWGSAKFSARSATPTVHRKLDWRQWLSLRMEQNTISASRCCWCSSALLSSCLVALPLAPALRGVHATGRGLTAQKRPPTERPLKAHEEQRTVPSPLIPRRRNHQILIPNCASPEAIRWRSAQKRTPSIRAAWGSLVVASSSGYLAGR
jgi:hypothetical protein